MPDAFSGDKPDKTDQIISLLQRIANASLQQDNELEEVKKELAGVQKQIQRMHAHVERLVKSHDGDHHNKPLLDRLKDAEHALESQAESIKKIDEQSSEDVRRVNHRITQVEKERRADKRFTLGTLAGLIVAIIAELVKLLVEHSTIK